MQFTGLRDDLSDGLTLQVMDFAKNRGIIYQDEIKSAFYTHQQVSMHPIVTYYKADVGLVKNSSIIISEDNQHDGHAAHHFQGIVNEHMSELRGQKPTRTVFFSDGCAAQYLSKGPFADMSLTLFQETTLDQNMGL